MDTTPLCDRSLMADPLEAPMFLMVLGQSNPLKNSPLGVTVVLGIDDDFTGGADTNGASME
jgi:hypothetical protein